MADGTMSVAEAGRRGGRANLARHGVEHYRAMGRQGGAALARERGREHMAEIGRLGGQAGRGIAKKARRQAD